MMTLAARCTHCHTVFRISGPQLAAAQGWVRCGGCGQVFDASANLVTPSGQPLDIPTVDTRAAEPLRGAEGASLQTGTGRREAFDGGPAAAPPLQAMPDIDLELPDLGELRAEAAPSTPAKDGTQAAPTPEVANPPPAVAPARDEREPFWVDPSMAQPAVGSPHQDTAAAPVTEPQVPAPAPATVDLRGPLADHHSASPPVTTSPAAGGRSGGGTWAYTLAALTLCLSLLALSGYALRGHIAQAWPEARPLVVQACSVLGCELPPIRLLDALSVQGSSLSLDDGTGHHRLKLQIRNTSDGAILTPAFDFSLVDVNGQVLARRMLDPTEFDSTTAQLDAGADVTLTIALNLRTLDAAAIASFRVVPYYP